MINNKEYFKQLFNYIHIAEKTPIKELCLRGDYKNNPDLHYPSNKGEELANNISSLLISKDFYLTTNECQRLDEMTNVSSALDINNSNKENWSELFKLANEFETKCMY